MTDLERRWIDPDDALSVEEMVKLINLLIKERDAWLFNAKELQKQNNKLLPNAKRS